MTNTQVAITKGVFQRRGALALADATVSNCQAERRTAEAHAAIHASACDRVAIHRVTAMQSQRGFLWQPNHEGGTWLTGEIDRLTVDGYVNVYDRDDNMHEAVLFHGSPKAKYPDQTGIEDFRIRNVTVLNRPGGLTLWRTKIKRLQIDAVRAWGVDILVEWPIERLGLMSLDVDRVLLRLGPACTADMLGDIELDDRYQFEVHDLRGRWNFPESRVGLFDRIGNVRDWLTLRSNQ